MVKSKEGQDVAKYEAFMSDPPSSGPAADNGGDSGIDSSADSGVDSGVDSSEEPTAGGEPHIVGVGASAGGLEALEEFFAHMPNDTGFAFVVVQHLSPDFRSLMDELLARRTSMVVHRVEHGVRIEPNAIYVIPPKQELRLSGGRLMLKERVSGSAIAMPIDIFFESLAHETRERAIAVVLSGSGSDGSRGVRTVHEMGGTVLVQRPESAKFDGMPKSALETGVADFTGTPAELPQLVLRSSRRTGKRAKQEEETQSGIMGVLALLRKEHGLDFRHYKPNTISRRVDRRRLLKRIANLDAYLAYLGEHPEEVQALYWDLLIGVTRFFRDAEAFTYLREQVVPRLIDEADSEQGLRVWVAGCATGEEAYSLAILLREVLEARGAHLPVKIFATDVHRASLEIGAKGCYSHEALAGLDEACVQRHFKHVGDEFQVVPEIRHMVVFAAHDVLRDAPFTRLDLVTCRNLLIYLKPAAQKSALSLMHFGLKPRGVLFLGPSETPGDLTNEFDVVNRHWKVFRKRRDLPLTTRMTVAPVSTRSGGATRVRKEGKQDTRQQRALQALLGKHAPPSILVGPEFEVLYTFCGGGNYLAHSDGKPSLNVLDLVSDELKLTLNAALQRAQKTRSEVSYSSIRTAGEEKLNLHIAPLQDPEGWCYLISIEVEEEKEQRFSGPRADIPEISRERIENLEEQLRFTKENLQATLEEMETANEELQATNEELVASNEELQSTNEELHSVNEELFTVNAEHQRKIDLLTELTEDMENLFSATDVGTVFLDRELKIRRFTPRVAELFHLLPQDTGRSIVSFAHNLNIPRLVEDMQHVLATESPCQRQAPDHAGNWYLVRLTPYRVGSSVEGVVVSFVDITTLKQTEARLELMSNVFKAVADPVVVEDINGVIVDLNPEAERVYGRSRDELLGKPGLMLVPEESRADEVELRRRCREQEYVRNVETRRMASDGETHPVLATLSRVQAHTGEPPVIAIITKDITLRQQAERAATEAVRRRDEFLAMLSHELRNPLAVIQNAALVLSTGAANPQQAARCHDVILRQVEHMASLLSDLLDVSRVTQGKVDLQRARLDLRQPLEEAVEGVLPAIERRRQQLDVSVAEEAVEIVGDRARLRQIQENLLTNASKYTPDGGRISLELLRSGEQALIRVTDTGRGIEPGKLESIFDLFMQAESKLDRSDGGMGVGLTLVRTLVELHRGSVRAFSHGRNKGSVFEVTLPLAAENTGDETLDSGDGIVKSATIVRSRAGESLDVLIVEDNEDARDVLKMLLEVDGHCVRVAADGAVGLTALETQPPDVALIDIGLPGLNGYEVARRVRAKFGASGPRLIALSGYGRSDDRDAVRQAGFERLLVKPVSREQLSAALRVTEVDVSEPKPPSTPADEEAL